jgi:site-specific recombinase XerD
MIARLAEQHLGTSKVHALRHTFAREMEADGAKTSEIQARLGHASMATTGIYLAALKSAENSHAESLARRFGFEEEDA